MKSLPISLHKIQNFYLISRWRNFQWTYHFHFFFWKFLLWKMRWNSRVLHSAFTFDVFVENIVTNFTSTKDYLWLWYNKYRNIEILILNYLTSSFRDSLFSGLSRHIIPSSAENTLCSCRRFRTCCSVIKI